MPSSPVQSNQTGVHPDLDQVVAKHMNTQWRSPVAGHTQEAFGRFTQWWADNGSAPLILDSGCGTALSSITLGQRHPDCAVVGIDQSAHRLDRATQRAANNVLLLRAECADFWRLLEAAGIQLTKHFLLYPNPWPKSDQLKRRWHGHPVFPTLKALGGTTELRTNWNIYAEEFARASTLLFGSGAAVTTTEFDPADAPLTAFERKYVASGHRLYQVFVNPLSGGP